MTHHAAVIDPAGRHLADAEFPATIRGYRDLLDWMRSHGELVAVGVESTGAYGAELARVLTAAGGSVVDVDRPDRETRRMKGKSDPIDAYAAQEIARTAARLRYFAELDTGSRAITDGRPVRSEIRWRPQAHPHWPSRQVVKADLTSGSGHGTATPHASHAQLARTRPIWFRLSRN